MPVRRQEKYTSGHMSEDTYLRTHVSNVDCTGQQIKFKEEKAHNPQFKVSFFYFIEVFFPLQDSFSKV